MAAPTDPSQLNSARAALPALRTSLLGALYDAAVAEQALTDARRNKTNTSTEATNAANADAALVAARTAFDNGVQAVNDAIAAWFVDTAGTQPNSVLPADDVNRMPAAVPIIFFPLRIETRFEGSSLKLRVYPDEIFFNSHETALTLDEQKAAQNYYTNLNKPGVTTDDGQKADWRDLVKEFGAPRAAYILRAMLPNEFVETTPHGPNPTVPTGQGISLTFPTVALRPRAFTRPAEALLPDRWVVMTRRGNSRQFFYGSPIREPMFVTVDPAPAAKQSVLPNGYTVDDRTRWTIDFDTAVSVGMALTIPLVGNDAVLGFDRVVVFGVKTTLPADQSADALARLIDAHHYTRGIAFMRQESATNNTQDRRTSVPLADDAGAASFAIERAIPPLSRDSWRFSLFPSNFEEEIVDGNFWAGYLGLPAGILQQVDRALESEIPRALAMNRLLWPVTFGSFLKFMMDPVITPDGVDKAKTFFLDAITARGVAPVLRIGQVPYGLLPVASLQQWHVRNDLGESADTQTVETKLLLPLRRLVQIWKTAASGVKRLHPQSSNPDVDLLSALALYSTSRDVRLRTGYGASLLYDVFNLLSWDFGAGLAAFDRATADLFQRLGHPEWRPRIGRTMFFKDSLFVTTPFVDLDKNLSEDKPLASDYLTGLVTAAPGQLITNTVTGRPNPDSLLYELLRISTLTEYALQLDKALKNTPGYSPWVNAEVFGLAGLPSTSVVLLLFDPNSATIARNAASEHVSALSSLIGVPTAELDRLTRETLDLASHRLDPWVTAFASRRVLALRRGEESATSRLGGYAWVEDLRPQARATATAPDGNPAEVDFTNGGFIHSPSSQHAMAAAVLRNGYLSYSREDPQKYAFDLSSRQVRAGVQVLQEVAAGRHLGEVLGYRFERGLQDDHPGVPNLNAFRFAFRTAFPLVAGKDGVDTAAPPDRAAAPNLVDGLSLYRAYKAGTIVFAPPLPTQGSAAHGAVLAELNNLGQMLDAVADVMVAEGVYQLAGANLTGAAASLDNLVRGGHPPEPGIAQSPRAGRGLTHRVVYLFQKNALPMLPPNWDTPSARALAEPVLNAWIGSLIGDPQNVTATVKYSTAAGPQPPAPVTLKDLKLQPLDLLALAHASLQANQASLLERRIQAVIADVAGNTDVTVDYTPGALRNVTTNRTFPEIVELLVTLGATLGGSRALGIDDLLAPSDLTETLPLVETAAKADAAELLARANVAKGTLDGVVTTLGTTLTTVQQNPTDATAQGNLRNAIRACGTYAPERAWASATDTAAALTDTATALLKELKRRQDAVVAATPGGTSSAEVLPAATAMLQAIFGTDMFLLPQVTPPRPDELSSSLNARSTLLGSDATVLPQFLQQAMHGRAQLSRYRKFSLYARALGSPSPGLSLVQLPYVPGEQWLGRPFPPGFDPDASRTSVILLSQASTVDPTQQPWRGIVVENFTEIIPSPKQQTSIAFNYNGPRAEAPHSILVMAPSGSGNQWDINDIAASLEETLDLAKVRAVDRDLLGSMAQLLPAIVIPNDTDPNITTSSGAIAQLARLTAAAKVGFQ